jgi:hypothetical protein
MMRRTALLLVGALALANAKFITRGDDSNVLACDVCTNALTDAGSHALAFAPACGAAFDSGMHTVEMDRVHHQEPRTAHR